MNALEQLKRVAVIIPLGPREDLWERLLKDLGHLPVDTEIVLVYSDAGRAQSSAQITYSGQAADLTEKLLPKLLTDSGKGLKLLNLLGRRRLILVQSQPGRACEMNNGAAFASKDYLWFLHADSHFTKSALAALNSKLAAYPDVLHFFRLAFTGDGGTTLVGINQWGARIRSEVFGVPFGDQGFCISGKNFEHIGGYPEGLPYGEDHLFLWRARQLGIRAVCTGTELFTSARKYRIKGWGRVTLTNQYIWLKQAVPEYIKLLSSKGRQ